MKQEAECRSMQVRLPMTQVHPWHDESLMLNMIK